MPSYFPTPRKTYLKKMSKHPGQDPGIFDYYESTYVLYDNDIYFVNFKDKKLNVEKLTINDPKPSQAELDRLFPIEDKSAELAGPDKLEKIKKLTGHDYTPPATPLPYPYGQKELTQCNLINMSVDPETHPDKLKDLLKGEPAYVLHNQKIFYVDKDAKVKALKNTYPGLGTIFPEKIDELRVSKDSELQLIANATRDMHYRIPIAHPPIRNTMTMPTQPQPSQSNSSQSTAHPGTASPRTTVFKTVKPPAPSVEKKQAPPHNEAKKFTTTEIDKVINQYNEFKSTFTDSKDPKYTPKQENGVYYFTFPDIASRDAFIQKLEAAKLIEPPSETFKGQLQKLQELQKLQHQEPPPMTPPPNANDDTPLENPKPGGMNPA